MFGFFLTYSQSVRAKKKKKGREEKEKEKRINLLVFRILFFFSNLFSDFFEFFFKVGKVGAATKSKGRLSAISSHRGWWRLQVFLCRRKRLIMKSHSTRIQRSCRNKANEWRVLRVFLQRKCDTFSARKNSKTQR